MQNKNKWEQQDVYIQKEMVGLIRKLEKSDPLVKTKAQHDAANILAWCFLIGWLILIFSCVNSKTAHASEYTDDQIVAAIGKAECGKNMDKCTYWYGIRSVSYESKEEAKRICLRTVKNNRIRFAKQSKYGDFLEFLASRYAPTKGATNDPKGLNNHWLKNVRYFLKKAEA